MFFSPLALKRIAEYLDELIEARNLFSQNGLASLAGVGPNTIARLRKNRLNSETEINNVPTNETLVAIARVIPDPRTGQPFSEPRDILRMASGELSMSHGEPVHGDLPDFLRREMVRLGVSPAQLAALLRISEARLNELFAGAVPNVSEVLEMGRRLRDDGDATPFFKMIGIDVNRPIKSLNGSH